MVWGSAGYCTQVALNADLVALPKRKFTGRGMCRLRPARGMALGMDCITAALRLGMGQSPRSKADRAGRRSPARKPPAHVRESDYDLLRCAARRNTRTACLGKPHELSAHDGVRIIVGEGARDTARCDRVMDACRQYRKDRAPVDQSATLMRLLEIPMKASL